MTARLRSISVSTSVQLITEECSACGIVYAVPEDFNVCCKRDKKTFYCPNGHAQVYGENEADLIRRERDRLKQILAQRDDEICAAADRTIAYRNAAERERRRANGYKGHAARITKRAKGGVCPCCNRHFEALQRHMATKHPTFTPDCSDPPAEAEAKAAVA